MFLKASNSIIYYLTKWIFIALIIGSITGAVGAFFLNSLYQCSTFREEYFNIILLLPLAGLCIGGVYHYFGKTSNKGNNLIFETYYNTLEAPRIPFRMLPFVLFGTLATHLFGGSAGREGTAVQIGATLAEQCSRFFKFTFTDRKTLLQMGIAAGFSAVFGTPLAATFFALEVVYVGQIYLKNALPCLLVALIADKFCLYFGGTHGHYIVDHIPDFEALQLFYSLCAGVCFGGASLLFSSLKKYFTLLFKKYISFPPLRPFVGGCVLAIIIFTMGGTRHIGLGLPVIESAFYAPMYSYDFLVKIILTAFTLGAGFKGGEVTPLFFIGATLGNVLALIFPLPMSLLAAMGFIAVFAGATHTPIACLIMGIELFGIETGKYIAIAAVIAYLVSGKKGVYSAQKNELPKF